MKRRQLAQFGAALSAGMAWPQLMAQTGTYPSRSVRFIIPFAPGGGSDIVGRVICAKLQEAFGQAFVPDNRAGGNSVIGLNACAKAPPDGYVLSLLTGSATVNVSLQGTKQPYDLQKDLAPITQITVQPYSLVVNPKLPVKNLADLIAFAKANPGVLNYGSSGHGGISHLAGELLCSMAKVKMTHVPYKGGSLALNDVVSGQISMMFSSQLQAQPFTSSGRLRMIGVTTARRSPATPDVPTLSESGVPGYDIAGWYGLAADVELGALREMSVLPLIAAQPDGLAASSYMMAPGACATGPDPVDGGGQFWLVMAGQMLDADQDRPLHRLSMAFVRPEDPPYVAQAGSGGLHVVLMQFPRFQAPATH